MNFIVIWAARLMVSFRFIPVVVGLNCRRATRGGAIALMLGGMATWLISFSLHRLFVASTSRTKSYPNGNNDDH